jgi:hypothetical protein
VCTISEGVAVVALTTGVYDVGKSSPCTFFTQLVLARLWSY